MHLECGRIDEETGTDKFIMLNMVAQNVTDVLTQEALDALTKLLYPINVLLAHAPSAVRGVRSARLEFLDSLFHLIVPTHIRDEVLDRREGPHRLYGDRLVYRNGIQARHAHQL